MSTDLDRLRDAVVQAARKLSVAVECGHPTLDRRLKLDAALAALDAHPTRATAETVRVGIWQHDDGMLAFYRAGSATDATNYPSWTRLGATTLRLDTEAAG